MIDFLLNRVALVINKTQKKAKQEILKNIRHNIYQFEDVNCLNCLCNDLDLFSKHDMYGLNQDLALCKKCGLLFVQKQLTDSSLNLFYNSHYRKLDRGVETVKEDFYKKQYTKGQKIFDYIETHIQNDSGHILEIGCGSGGILGFFRDKGYFVKGIDIGKEYLEYGKNKYDLDLSTDSLDDLLIYKNENNIKFSVIILEQVLEHFKNPRDMLRKIREIMDESTLIYIGVPGLRNIENHYQSNFHYFLQFPHLTYFELNTLKYMLNQEGFYFLDGNEVIQGIFRKSDDMVEMEVINYKEVHKYIKFLSIDFKIKRCKYIFKAISKRIH